MILLFFNKDYIYINILQYGELDMSQENDNSQENDKSNKDIETKIIAEYKEKEKKAEIAEKKAGIEKEKAEKAEKKAKLLKTKGKLYSIRIPDEVMDKIKIAAINKKMKRDDYIRKLLNDS